MPLLTQAQAAAAQVRLIVLVQGLPSIALSPTPPSLRREYGEREQETLLTQAA